MSQSHTRSYTTVENRETSRDEYVNIDHQTLHKCHNLLFRSCSWIFSTCPPKAVLPPAPLVSLTLTPAAPSCSSITRFQFIISLAVAWPFPPTCFTFSQISPGVVVCLHLFCFSLFHVLVFRSPLPIPVPASARPCPSTCTWLEAEFFNESLKMICIWVPWYYFNVIIIVMSYLKNPVATHFCSLLLQLERQKKTGKTFRILFFPYIFDQIWPESHKVCILNNFFFSRIVFFFSLYKQKTIEF